MFAANLIPWPIKLISFLTARGIFAISDKLAKSKTTQLADVTSSLTCCCGVCRGWWTRRSFVVYRCFISQLPIWPTLVISVLWILGQKIRGMFASNFAPISTFKMPYFGFSRRSFQPLQPAWLCHTDVSPNFATDLISQTRMRSYAVKGLPTIFSIVARDHASFIRFAVEW
jgi:hypothetical protein